MCDDLLLVKEALTEKLIENLDCLDCCDTDELSHIIKMIKHIDEAVYYCTVTSAMNNEYNTDSSSDSVTVTHDLHEGRSGVKRKAFMEAKENHLDRTAQLKALENYTTELTNDVLDMVTDATQEEKTMLQNKIATLANKLV